MGVLASSHPDVLSFIRAKKNGDLKNFNLSVGIDRHFFDSYDRKGTYDLINPRNGEVSRTIDTGILWEELCSAAWQCGDPGILFLDRINDLNPVPGLGPIEATNPCGEQPLLPYESCNLGSLNVAGFVRKGELDEDKLVSAVRSGVEFLDAVIDINTYPVPEIRDRTLLTRKIGLGIMGLADALIIMEIPYASNEGLTFAESIMQLIQQEAHIVSEELGEKKGSFPAIDRSCYSGPMRNATVTTFAPTGSLHIIAGTSSGIEPLSLAFSRIIKRKSDRVCPSLSGKSILSNHCGSRP